MAARDAIYQEIINLARERVREARWRSDRERVAVEEAHLKLIPRLLHCPDERRHRHYLLIDRPRFVRASRAVTTSEFEPLWSELAEIVALHAAHAPAEEVPLARLAGPARLGYEGPARRDGKAHDEPGPGAGNRTGNAAGTNSLNGTRSMNPIKAAAG
jgi:hypothetical protein